MEQRPETNSSRGAATTPTLNGGEAADVLGRRGTTRPACGVFDAFTARFRNASTHERAADGLSLAM